MKMQSQQHAAAQALAVHRNRLIPERIQSLWIHAGAEGAMTVATIEFEVPQRHNVDPPGILASADSNPDVTQEQLTYVHCPGLEEMIGPQFVEGLKSVLLSWVAARSIKGGPDRVLELHRNLAVRPRTCQANEPTRRNPTCWQ
jgi:hypothetical protein